MEKKKNVAILGGAFNPPQLAHLMVAKFVLLKSGWADEVWMMPAYKHIDGKKMVSPDHRLKMLELLTEEEKNIVVSDYEIKKKLSGETYTLLSNITSEEEYKDINFAFVIGMDRANNIDKFSRSKELLELGLPFIVIPRKGVKENKDVDWYKNEPNIFIPKSKDFPIPDFSSTKARELIGCMRFKWCGEELQKIVGKKVTIYILDNKLYKT